MSTQNGTIHYQLSKECISCIDSFDGIKDVTFAEQETACLKEELSRLQTRLDVTLNIITSFMDLSSKRTSISHDQRQLLQDKIKYLHQSSSHFVNFIEKFCDNNSSHLYHSRSGFSACYHQLMDYLNMHLSHLRQIFAFYVDINSDADTLCLLFANVIDDIVKTSKDNKILTYAEHQKIDIFLCLTNFLKGTQFDDQQRTLLLDKLKYLSVHEKNDIASVLYEKLKALL